MRSAGPGRNHFDDYGIFSFSPFSGHSSFESFPSGHATTIGAFFAAFSLLFPRYRIVFLACALWLGMTRVMVGAHYPSDVIAGLALGGWFSLMIGHRLFPLRRSLQARRRLAGTEAHPARIKNPASCERRVRFQLVNRRCSVQAWMSRFFVSGRKIRPMTSVIAAKTIGYHRP